LVGQEKETQKPSNVVLDDPDALGPLIDEFAQQLPAVGQLNDAVQVIDGEQISIITGGINTHLAGRLESFDLGIDVTYTDNADIQVGKRLFLQQFQKESACASASDNARFRLIFLKLDLTETAIGNLRQIGQMTVAGSF
jgi:hypothetical protein